MKALVLICLLFVGCDSYSPVGEKRDYGLRESYKYNNKSFVTTDSCIIMSDEFGESRITINSMNYRLHTNGNTEIIIVFDLK